MLNKGFRILFLFVLFLFIFSHSHGSEKVVVMVNGAPITEADVERQIDIELPKVLYHDNITEERRLKYREKAIEDLIVRELLYQEARREGITVKRSKVDEVFYSYKMQYGGEEGLKKALGVKELDVDKIKKEIEKTLVIDEFEKSYIEKKAGITDAELREYYEKNRESFREPDKVRLREIFISVPYDADYKTIEEKRKKAEDVMKRIKMGEDFADLAWKYSDDPYAVKGGDIGYMHRGRLSPELEEVAFRLKPKEVSGLIEVKAGFFIIKVEDFVSSRLIGFDEIKNKLRKELYDKRRKEIKEDIIRRAREKATIEVRENR